LSLYHLLLQFGLLKLVLQHFYLQIQKLSINLLFFLFGLLQQILAG